MRDMKRKRKPVQRPYPTAKGQRTWGSKGRKKTNLQRYIHEEIE